MSLIAVYASLQTEAGRTWLARSLEAALSQPGHRKVTIGRVEGHLPGRIRIDEVTVADGAGAWLTVRQFALDWNPLALFRGRIEIESAAAQEIEFARRPVAAEADPEGGLPSMPPFDIAVKSVTVDALRLAKPVLGVAASARAAAQVTVSAEVIDARFDIVRADAIEGRANAVLSYDPRTRFLDLHAELSEPRGGLTARLLQLPQLPAVDLLLAGGGPAADWRGTVTLEAEEMASLRSLLAVSIDGPRVRIALEGTVRPGRASNAVTAVFGPQTEFALALMRPDGSGRLSVTVERLRSAAMDGAGSGDIDLKDGNMEARLRMATRDATRIAPFIAPVELDSATVEGRLSGPLTHPVIDFDAEIGAPRIGDWSTRRIDLHAQVRPDGPMDGLGAIRMAGQATLSQPRGPLQELNTALGDSVRITVTQAVLEGRTQLTIGDAAVAGGQARGTITGGIALETGGMSMHGAVELDDLSPLSGRLGRPLGGRLGSSYDVSYDPAEGLSIKLDGTVYDGRFGLAVAESLLGPRAAFAGRIDRHGDGRWEISDVAVHGAGATAAGRLSVPPGAASIAAEYRVNVSDLATLDLADPARPGGHLDIRGTVAGPARNPTIDGTATLTDVAPAGFVLDRLAARYTLPATADELKGRIELEAQSALLPDLAGRFDFALKKQAVELASLRLTARGTVVRGNLAIPLAGPPLSGALTVEIDDLGAWSPAVDRQLAGSLKAEATLSADQGRQQVVLKGAVKSFALDGAVFSQDVSATARVSDALAEQRLAISVTADTGSVGPVQLRSLAADYSGTLANAEISLRANGDYRGALRLEAGGTVRRDGTRTVVTVARLAGEAMGAPFNLRTPAIAEFRPELESAAAQLTLADGTIDASLRRTPKDVSLEANVEGIPLALFWADAPTQIQTARINASAALSGPVARPDGRFDLSLTDIAPGELETAPQGLALNMAARLQNNVLVVDGRLAGLGEASAGIDAMLPVRVSLSPMSLQFDDTAPASGAVTYQGPIEPLAALVVLDRHRLEGKADIRLKLAGPLGDPRVEGGAQLTAGRYENLDTGTVLTNIQLRVRPVGGSIVVDEATASDGDSGRITVTGGIGIGWVKGVTLALDAVFEKARLVRRDELTAVSSGTVSLRGDESEQTIAGRLNIEEAEIRLIAGTTSDIVHIEVEETGTPPVGTPPPPPARKPSKTSLDLALSMPKRVFVRGRGLESEWGGELLVTGTTASPRLQGNLRPLRGRYDFLGKIFTLRDGSIDFTGAEQIDPALDLSAERAVTDMTAIIQVTGTARRPVVKLGSVPEVPQDEVLSRVLFNKSTGRLSATEAVQLAQAAATMTGATSGGGIMDFGRRMLNLDVLEVKKSGEPADGAEGGQTSVEAGKYLTDDVYIGVESGAAGATGATVEIEVTPRLRIEGDVGQKEKESIGLKWKRDY